MGWFSVFSIALFMVLISRSVRKMLQSPHARGRQALLVLVFSIHIAVIVYLGLD